MGEEPSEAEMGLTPKDMIIKIEEKQQSKSLTGEDLPTNWPQITPSEVYQHRLKGGVPVDDFSLKLKQGKKELSYLAVEHTSDPENPQFNTLERNFKEMSPQVVLHEGPTNSGARFPDREAAIKYGEVGFLTYLVYEHNNNLQNSEKPIKIESTDMSDIEWIEAFQEGGYSNEEIAVYDVLRKINITAEKMRRDNPAETLPEEELEEVVAELTTQINNNYLGYASEKGFPNLFAQLPRKDGLEWNNETIKEEVLRLTGKEKWSANVNQTNVPKFREMFDKEAEFRDKYVVTKIADTVSQNDRVMAVMGSSHVLREESALRELFGVSEQPTVQVA